MTQEIISIEKCTAITTTLIVFIFTVIGADAQNLIGILVTESTYIAAVLMPLVWLTLSGNTAVGITTCNRATT